MSGENSKNDNTIVLGLASAIVSKINSLISSHNSNTSAHSDKESISNKVTSWSSTTNNAHYPSEKLVKDSLDAKQNTLVSGTTIKTVNNNSLLGSGNISIQSESGGSNITDYYYDTTNDEIVLEYDSGVTQADIVTSWSNILSDDNVPSEKLVKNSLDAISGGTVDSVLSSTSKNPVQNKVIYNALNSKISTSNTSGLVKNDGSIDTSNYLTSHQSLTNYIQKSQTAGLVKNDGTIDETSYLSSLPSHNHDDKYYTETEIDTALGNKQDKLTSGTTIKTINNTTLLGSGNISINGFSGSYSDLTNKPSYTATVTSSTTGAYKIGSIDISGSSVDIYGKDTDTQPPSASNTTPSADTTNGSVGDGTTWARSNHTHPKSSIYAESSHTHTTTDITNLSIPTASSSTPAADTTSGTYGSGTSYARSNHAHPKSSLYAEASHTHTYSNISNVTTVDVVVTYTDNSTETIKLLKYTGT